MIKFFIKLFSFRKKKVNTKEDIFELWYKNIWLKNDSFQEYHIKRILKEVILEIEKLSLKRNLNLEEKIQIRIEEAYQMQIEYKDKLLKQLGK